MDEMLAERSCRRKCRAMIRAKIEAFLDDLYADDVRSFDLWERVVVRRGRIALSAMVAAWFGLAAAADEIVKVSNSTRSGPRSRGTLRTVAAQ